MRKSIVLALLLYWGSIGTPVFAGALWQRVAAKNVDQGRYLSTVTYKADVPALKVSLSTAVAGSNVSLMELPMPDGTFRVFRVERNSLLPPALAAKFPELQTYTAIANDNSGITAKLDYTLYGFHAMIYDGDNTSFVDPANDVDDGYYSVHFKKDEISRAGEVAGCLTDSKNILNGQVSLSGQRPTAGGAQRVINGYDLRRYRIALSCTHQYAQKVTNNSAPSKTEVLSHMVTTMNRVNGVYERELAVSMVLINDEDKIIFTTDAGDPLGAYNSSELLTGENQKVCDTLIGDANYDIGHSFSTGGGGSSIVGMVCKTGSKGASITGRDSPSGDGFDIDYVAHEIGHAFGAEHTFNTVSGHCSGNGVFDNAYEPGSGSTLMAYAGICDPDNIQAHSDAYFHTTSLLQITTYISGDGDVCASKSATGNKAPDVSLFSASYTIPTLTPFELNAPAATDPVGGSTISYCWEQWNLGDFGLAQAKKIYTGPCFRSYTPAVSTDRVFPKTEMVLNGLQSNAGVNNASGEKLPDTARYLTFRLAVRSVRNNYGCLTLPEDTIHIDVVNSKGGFKVTSHDAAGITLQGNSKETVTWDVAGTNNAPVNAGNVDIYLSADGGNTWTYKLGTFANTGSATVVIPNPDTNIAAARFKVKGAGNVFFNVNSKDFRVERNFGSTIKLYPVPASEVLHITSDGNGTVQATIFDITGRQEWQGEINASLDIPVALWARGIYVMKMADQTGRMMIRKFVIR